MTTRSLRWIALIVASAVVAAFGLITMYVTEAGPFGDQVEPLACRDLSRSGNLPAAKQDVIRRECEAARAGAARSPEPIVTPVAGSPAPLVPCDQWNPSSGGGCIMYGLIESRQPPAGYEHTYRVSNKWSGSLVTVYAGSLYDDATQGLLVVMENDTPEKDGSFIGEFPTPVKEGALRII